MTNKRRKKVVSKKVKIRLFFFFVIFGSIIGSLGYNFFSNINKMIEINNEKDKLKDKLTILDKEEESLNDDIKKLKDPEYVARYAREKYMYSKNGELIIRLPDEE